MRICLVYDCLYPWTVGGAERWYRQLAERLARDGHEVTILTLRQWPPDEPPDIPGVRVIAVGPRMELYVAGRRRIMPPLLFGVGVAAHLLRFGRRYEVVHTASFPYFPVLAIAVTRLVHRCDLLVDWFEFWTREYWESYLGRLRGRAGWWVQRLAARVRQRAFVFSRLHRRRLEESGFHGTITLLHGLYTGPWAGEQTYREPAAPAEPPTVMYAGRLIPEKRVPSLVTAFVAARAELPSLALDIYGDGPTRPDVEAAIIREGVGDAVRLLGFVEDGEIEMALSAATCLVLPSEREGYGLVVVEAMAHGCPAVVVDHPDNAATELIAEGINGFIASSDSAEDLGASIVRAVADGLALRRSTARYYADHARDLALESSLRLVADSYRTRL